MCEIPQLVSAPLNPIAIAEHFRRSHPQCELMSNLTRFVLELMHQSIPAAPSRALAFFCLGWQIPGGGDS